jgi:2-hydroxychromene-2-carboxylate isomerase
MSEPIIFYFDFSSPYSYLASEQIDALAARHQRTVDYRPILLGPVFKASGSQPLTDGYPPKAQYSVHDFLRSARFAGVPYRQPPRFPIGAVTASRAVLWLQQYQPQKATDFIHAVFRAFFAEARDITDNEVLADLARGCGLDATPLLAGVQQPETKELLKQRVDRAIADGVFGAPTIEVDGERFWGNDRLPQIERWLAQGPY